MIFHITSAEQWDEAQRLGEYLHESLVSEGFIHCSSQEQVEKTANRYFLNSPFILILHIEEKKLTSKLVFEPSTGGELFPHVYGPINLEAVTEVSRQEQSSDGFFYFTNTR